MKVYDNIKKWVEEHETIVKKLASIQVNAEGDLNRVLSDLARVRKSEAKTKRYYDAYLRYSTHQKEYDNKMRDRELNGLDVLKWDYAPIKGECLWPEDILHSALLYIINEDKYSFGHLYRLLATEYNRQCGYIHYNDTILSNRVIEYATDFDTDELQENFKTISSPVEKEQWVYSKLSDSKYVHNFEEDPILAKLKNNYESMAEILIGLIEKEIKIGFETPYKKSILLLYDLDLLRDPRYSSMRWQVHGACQADYDSNVFTFKAILQRIFSHGYDPDNYLKPDQVIFKVYPDFIYSMMASYCNQLHKHYESDSRSGLKKMYEWFYTTIGFINEAYEQNPIIYSTKKGKGDSAAETWTLKKSILLPLYQNFQYMVNGFLGNVTEKVAKIIPYNIWLDAYESKEKEYRGQIGLEFQERAVIDVQDNKKLFFDTILNRFYSFYDGITTNDPLLPIDRVYAEATSDLSGDFHKFFRDYVHRVQMKSSDKTEIDNAILAWLFNLYLGIYNCYANNIGFIKKRYKHNQDIDRHIIGFFFDICEKAVFQIAEVYFKDSESIPLVAQKHTITDNDGSQVVTKPVTYTFKGLADTDIEAIYDCIVSFKKGEAFLDGQRNEVSKDDFVNCIKTANMRRVYVHGVTTRMKYAIRVLKDYAEPSWLEAVCKDLNIKAREVTGGSGYSFYDNYIAKFPIKPKK